MDITRECKKAYILGLMILFLAGCSEKALPYEDSNNSISNTQEQGSIKTH